MRSTFSENTKFNLTSTQKDFHIANKSYCSPSRSKLQNIFGHPKPARIYQRLLRVKTADSGTDPAGALKEFISHDIVKPMDRPGNKIDIENAKEFISSRSGRWALKTSKACSSQDKISHFEPFKTYNFPKIEVSNGLDNDSQKKEILSIIPNLKRNLSCSGSPKFIEKKSRFSISTTTFGNSWMPQGNQKTMNNMSSVDYNILSPFEKNNSSGMVVMKCLDKKIASKKKGVGEFSDLTRKFNPNYFPKFIEAYKEDKNVFRKYNGVFTYLYDSACRNGDLIVPFKNEKDKSVLQKENEKRRTYLNSLREKYELRNKSNIASIKSENISSKFSSQNNINLNPIINNNKPAIINNPSGINSTQKLSNDKTINNNTNPKK